MMCTVYYQQPLSSSSVLACCAIPHAPPFSDRWQNDVMHGNGGTKVEKDGRRYMVHYVGGKLQQSTPVSPLCVATELHLDASRNVLNGAAASLHLRL